MKIRFESFCDCGPRSKNEDYITVRQMPGADSFLFMVCDGMGGHEFGDVASRLVAEQISDYWVRNPEIMDSEKKVLDACNETMVAFNNQSRGEMGTTMAMVSIEGGKATLAHCGDSRIYVVRDKKIIFQSVDHVAVTPEGWPIITRAFFTGRNNYRPDIKEIEIQDGDMILVCSDGVFGNGKWSQVQEALTKGDSFTSTMQSIKNVASTNPHDNYSAILIHIQCG